MATDGSYPKGKAKREEILRTALRVIGRTGYTGTSLQELADAVGLTRAGVLHYFDSKEHLFTEILKARDAASAVEYDVDATMVERSRQAIQRNVADPGLMQLYVQLAAQATTPSGPAHDFFVERTRLLREYLVQVADELRSEGKLAADLPPEVFALFVMAVADGLQSLWLIAPDFDIADVLRICLGLVVTEDGTLPVTAGE